MNVNSYEYLKLLLDTSHEGVVACDNNFNITYINKRISEIHGSTGKDDPHRWPEYVQVFEMDGVTLTPQDKLPLFRALKGEKVIGAYHVLKYRNQPAVLVKYHAEPLIDENGNQIGALLTAEDKEDLASTLARFKAIFEQSALSIQIMDKTGKTLLVNEAYKKLWEISDEFVETYVLEKYNILEDELLIKSGEIEYIKKAFAGETVRINPFLYDPASLGLPGRARWAGGIIFPLKNANGEVHEVVIIHQDVTDQRIAESERERLFSQLEAILRQMPAGIMVADSEAKISLYNEQMMNLIGDPNQAYQTFEQSLINSMRGEVEHSNEIEIKHNNVPKYVSTSSGPIYDPEGRITASVLIAKEITREKRIEANEAFLARVKTLLVSTIEYDKILNKLADVVIPYVGDACMIDIIESDQLKRILTKHCEPEAEKLMNEMRVKFPLSFGSPVPSMRAIESGKPELISKVDIEILKQRTTSLEHLELVQKIGSRSHMTFPLQVRGKILGALNFIVTDPSRPLFDEIDFELGHNIARYASLVMDNARLYRDAKSAIQLRDDFISIASHELRTPITSMNLQIEVLRNIVESIRPASKDGETMHRFLDSTKNQLYRLTRLVDDMLDISRIDSGKLKFYFRKNQLKKIIQDVLNRFDDQIRSANLEVKFFCEKDIEFHCDGERMDQVITNLMTNAIRYGSKSPIHIYLEEQTDKIVIKVQDFGRGIAKEDHDRIFKRFERAHTSEDVSGLGLGLYINKQIVEEHKGKLLLESELEQGSTFIVELPKT